MQITRDIGWLFWDIYIWFYLRYIELNNYPYPLSYLSTPFQIVGEFFYGLSNAFFSFDIWIADVIIQLNHLLSIEAITGYFQTWINYATNAWYWIVNSWNNIIDVINSWWSSIQPLILAWIEQAKQWTLSIISSLQISLTEVVTWWNSFKANIPSLNEIFAWFSNWWNNISIELGKWWNERLNDIQSFFNSWAFSLKPFWDGWQDIREEVFKFINNPFDWLLDKFMDWFLGGK